MIAMMLDLWSALGDFTSLAQVTNALFDSVLNAATVAAASDDEGSTGWLLAAGPAAGGGVYWVLYRYYRNTDKSHQFERDTLIEAQPVQGSDVKVDEVHGTQRKTIEGMNGQAHRQRVRRIP